MLVLSRKAGQTIEIGDGVSVVVQKIKGGTVSIGVVADRSVPVRRGELPKRNDEGSRPCNQASV